MIHGTYNVRSNNNNNHHNINRHLDNRKVDFKIMFIYISFFLHFPLNKGR